MNNRQITFLNNIVFLEILSLIGKVQKIYLDETIYQTVSVKNWKLFIQNTLRECFPLIILIVATIAMKLHIKRKEKKLE